MSDPFDATTRLRTATGRAKSDVANKLVSMFLHEISRRASKVYGTSVSDLAYGQAVRTAFGNRCVYCTKVLEPRDAVVEHLEGMNRFRIGLHVPGNVAMACVRCNSEKRRDDQNPSISLSSSGWRSFLMHDGSRCPTNCKTCGYWSRVFDERDWEKTGFLQQRVHAIESFQAPFSTLLEWATVQRPLLHERVETLYRECQQFATGEIERLIAEGDWRLSNLAKAD